MSKLASLKAPLWVRWYTYFMIFLYAMASGWIISDERALEKTSEISKWMFSKIGLVVDGDEFTIVVYGMSYLTDEK